MKGEVQHVCNPDRSSPILLPGRVYHRDHNRGCEPAQLIDFYNKWARLTVTIELARAPRGLI